MAYQISKSNIKSIAEYVFGNCKYNNIEILEYIIIEINNISKICNLNVEVIENNLIDRTSICYKLLVDCLKYIISINDLKASIYILDENPFFYICTNLDYVQDLLDRGYYEKLEYILKYKNNNEKGYYYQDLVLIFMEDFKVECVHRGKSSDEGIDFIGSEKIGVLCNNLKVPMYLCGQIKCYAGEVKPFEIKQLIKDYIYKSMKDGNMLYNLCRKLFFISHNGFTESSKKYARTHNIIILDSKDLIRLSSDHDKESHFLMYIEKEYKKLIKQ